MVTLSVTRSRVAGVLARAADQLDADGWDPDLTPIMAAIDTAAGFVPGTGTPDAEATSLAAWDALCQHLGDQYPRTWETRNGRTQAEVLDALRAASAMGELR
ncbi:hypothetical protein SUDANB145_07385 (plasmid) [Streptomyces sp. enrichment culture]|uniref:DUF6197 family protein n=1 Tax=Streptomyces sp. enrichment culture TaxID=1795815 RepID=UPI003F5672D6